LDKAFKISEKIILIKPSKFIAIIPDTGPLKNAIDWASRGQNCWADKAAAIVSAGGGFGGGRSQYHLRQVGVFLDLHFINKPELFVQAFQPPQKFDTDGNLIDADIKVRLRQVILSLQAFTLRLKGEGTVSLV
jgi:chromate reductase, NAD(P)H dehydrogenase (quinone)